MDDKGKLKLKGVSPKMLKRMKQEYVECPVFKRRYSILYNVSYALISKAELWEKYSAKATQSNN